MTEHTGDRSWSLPRLQLARHRRRLSRRELAQRLDLPLADLALVESGGVVPGISAHVLAAAVDVPVGFLHLGDPPTPAGFSVPARGGAGWLELEATAVLAVELDSWLRDRFTIESATLPNVPGGRRPDLGAASLRQTFALGIGPAPGMVHLAELFGVRVLSSGVPATEIESVSFWCDGRPFILLAPDSPADRRRWSVARELGHLVLHGGGHHDPADPGARRRAEDFAAELLMPFEGLRRDGAGAIATRSALLGFARRWGVSAAVMLDRLQTLGIGDDIAIRGVQTELLEHGFGPQSGLQEQSPTLARIFGHLRSRRLPLRTVADQLGLKPSDLGELLHGLTPTLLAREPAQGDRLPGDVPAGTADLRIVRA